MLLNKPIALAVTTLASLVAQPCLQEVDPDPVVMVNRLSMPQFVPKELYVVDTGNVEGPVGEEATLQPSAVALYHQLRREFDISHTEMGNWLGVKRRTLYNWMKEPERAKRYGPRIEERLVTLSALKDEMEPEHRSILFRIAFSPIYGDPQFGEAILMDSTLESLVGWYDKLFSQFESYRSLHADTEQLV